MSTLTKQESLFLDRIALCLASAGGEVALPLIEQAAKKVLEDDTRMLNTLSKNDALRTEAVTHLSGRAYDLLKQASTIS